MGLNPSQVLVKLNEARPWAFTQPRLTRIPTKHSDTNAGWELFEAGPVLLRPFQGLWICSCTDEWVSNASQGKAGQRGSNTAVSAGFTICWCCWKECEQNSQQKNSCSCSRVFWTQRCSTSLSSHGEGEKMSAPFSTEWERTMGEVGAFKRLTVLQQQLRERWGNNIVQNIFLVLADGAFEKWPLLSASAPPPLMWDDSLTRRETKRLRQQCLESGRHNKLIHTWMEPLCDALLTDENRDTPCSADDTRDTTCTDDSDRERRRRTPLLRRQHRWTLQNSIFDLLSLVVHDKVGDCELHTEKALQLVETQICTLQPRLQLEKHSNVTFSQGMDIFSEDRGGRGIFTKSAKSWNWAASSAETR